MTDDGAPRAGDPGVTPPDSAPGTEPRARLPRSNRPVPRRRWYGRAMKIVRRVHMYLGLLMFPWILLYGVTGVLFNHPEIGRDIDSRTLSGKQMSALTGFQPWKPDELAAAVVAEINARSDARYELDAASRSAFTGWPLLAAPGPDGGRYVLIMRLDEGSATLATHPPGARPSSPPFAGIQVDLPGYRMSAVQEQVAGLLPALGIDAAAPLRAHPKIAPSLRFRMRDAEGRRWNATYDVGSGSLDGRLAESSGQIRLVELLGRLHTTHHYPVHGGVTWVWALLADMTGLTLALWAITGLAMWWQMKRTRVLGVIAISIALVIAAAVMTGTASDIQFGNLEAGGP